MSEIVKCDYCDSYIEYDETDYKVAFGFGGVGNQIYIICPECGKPITVGIADYPCIFQH